MEDAQIEVIISGNDKSSSCNVENNSHEKDDDIMTDYDRLVTPSNDTDTAAAAAVSSSSSSTTPKPSDRWNSSALSSSSSSAVAGGVATTTIMTVTDTEGGAPPASGDDENDEGNKNEVVDMEEGGGSSSTTSPSNSSSCLLENEGDDLFPTLEQANATANNDTTSSLEQMQIVPKFDEAKSKISHVIAQQADVTNNKKDNPASSDDEEEATTTTTALVVKNTTHNTTTNNNIKRKRATGLGNLGNTCFMNSTLQCLAHTSPLREYFLSGNFINDLNKDNPLGTGGELAREFASLLSQMWLITKKDEQPTTTSSTGATAPTTIATSRIYSPGNIDSALSSTTYPRSFKHTLGKHAEQFIGYDQHDSQELAIYLLDALHEDTNRIRKKPYIEKHEQGEDESDDVAASKAWDVHLQREDSRILEQFMGQIKSRLQCPKEGCGRVSTTFDPSMYLSVPIPGSMDRTMRVTFIPGGDMAGAAELTVKVCKNSTVEILRKHVVELARECYGYSEEELKEEDVQFADVFQQKVWTWLGVGYAIDQIKDNDVTVAHRLFPLKRVREEFRVYKVKEEEERKRKEEKEEEKKRKEQAATSSSTTSPSTIATPNVAAMSLLDAATKADLDTNGKWENTLSGFLKQPPSLYRITNERRSMHEERLAFYGKLIRFVQKCKACSDATPPVTMGAEEELGGGEEKKSNEDDGDVVMAGGGDGNANPAAADEESSVASKTVCSSTSSSLPPPTSQSRNNTKEDNDSQQTLEEVSFSSSNFRNVHTPHDLALLEYCAAKLLSHIADLKNKSSLNKRKKANNLTEDGIVVQIKIKKSDGSGGSGTTTVNYGGYGNSRNSSTKSNSSKHSWKIVGGPMIARLSSTLTVGGLRQMLAKRLSHALKTVENHPSMASSSSSSSSLEMDIMRQVALSYENSDGRPNSQRYNHSSDEVSALGSVTEDHLTNGNGIAFAKSTDDKEKELVATMVDNEGTIIVSWPTHLNDSFDEELLSAKEEYLTEAQTKERESGNNNGENKVSVMDCIAKYCETEQLDESEMWYCNRCQEHVRAWKQFHLYRTPPILIIHLKRFHFSATTHRRDKIDTLIDFPLEDLDLRDIVKHYGDGGEKEEPIYDCYAVSNHFGGLGGGHYTAYARADDGSWSNFDDSRVTTGVDESEVVSSAAYCLYYKRKDVVFDKEEGKEEDDVMTKEDDENVVVGFDQGVTSMPVSPNPCIKGGGDEESSTHHHDENDMEVDDHNQQGSDDGTAGSRSAASYATPTAWVVNDETYESARGNADVFFDLQ